MSRIFKTNNHKLAMTFMEILIAGFFMVVVFVIGWLISSSFTGVKKVRNYENAIFLANEAIEAVRAARSRELGSDDDKVYAVIMDARAMRLHNTYRATRENINGDGDFLNLVEHTEDTAWISRNAGIHVFIEP